MLRKANSKSSNRLSRQKSASSTCTKSIHIDPEKARQHAHAAATYAFARAQERKGVDMGRSAIPPREDCNIEHRRSSSRDNLADEGVHAIKRQQSVRFVGPKAIRHQQSIERGEIQDPVNEKVRTSSLRPMAKTNDIPVLAVYGPSSRSSSLGKASVSRGTSEAYMTTLAAYDEYYTKEDDVASTPSSYRRIRRSKSTKTLFSPLKATSILFSNGTSDSDYNDRIVNKVPWILNTEHQPVLKAPKSMSFLRGGRDYMSASMRQDHDTAVQVARDKFLHQIEQQRLREQPSFLFRARVRRDQKPLRQSVRSGSTGSNGMPIGSSIPAAQQKEVSLKVKARKASRSIKRALKNLFRHGGDDQDDNHTIPAQQAEACKPHDDAQTSKQANGTLMEFSDIPHPESTTVSAVASHVPSLHNAASAQQLRSRAGSVRSLRSEGSSKSRVTSWTSTVENTVNSRHAQAEKERQRLSIIQENGTHISSSSFKRPTVSGQFSAYPAFHRPHSAKNHVAPVPSPVDSQRVYSALMKRLDENSPKAKLYAQHMSSVEKLEIMKRIPPRSSSVGSRHSNHQSRTPPTIRHVKEDPREMQQEETLTSLPHENDDVFSPTQDLESTFSADRHQQPADVQTETSTVPQNQIYDLFPMVNASNGTILSPQQMAARNEPLVKPFKPSRAMRETRSTFFCQPSLNTRRSTSPYRQALAEADYLPVLVNRDASTRNDSDKVLLSASRADYSDPKDDGLDERLHAVDLYTESIYSQSTGGRTPPAQKFQPFILHEDDLPSDYRTAVASIDRPIYQPTPQDRRGMSRGSSYEWKGWLSSEVSALENVGGIDGLVKVDYALPSMPNSFRHVREHAQIIGEDIEIHPRTVSIPKQPTEIIRHMSEQPDQLKPILKQRSSASSTGIPIPPPLPPPPPPVPPRSPLRPIQSRTSLRSADTAITQGTTVSAPSSALMLAPLTNQQLLRPSSSTTLSTSITPAKLVKRNRRPSNPSKPSPGIGAAVEKQFGSTKSRASFSGTENRSPVGELYGAEEAGLMDPAALQELDAQALGSRRMVDLFLSSRRRRVAGSDEGNAFL